MGCGVGEEVKRLRESGGGVGGWRSESEKGKERRIKASGGAALLWKMTAASAGPTGGIIPPNGRV